MKLTTNKRKPNKSIFLISTLDANFYLIAQFSLLCRQECFFTFAFIWAHLSLWEIADNKNEN